MSCAHLSLAACVVTTNYLALSKSNPSFAEKNDFLKSTCLLLPVPLHLTAAAGAWLVGKELTCQLPLDGLLGPARASPSAVHLYFSRVSEISNFVATVWGYLPRTYLIFL